MPILKLLKRRKARVKSDCHNDFPKLCGMPIEYSVLKSEFSLDQVIKKAYEIQEELIKYHNQPIRFKDEGIHDPIQEKEKDEWLLENRLKIPPIVNIQLRPSTIDEKSIIVKYLCGPACFDEYCAGEEYVRPFNSGNLDWELKNKESKLYNQIKTRVAKIIAAGIIVIVLGQPNYLFHR